MVRWLGMSVLACVIAAPVAVAQQLEVPRTPILTIEPDRLYAESAFGQRAAADLERAGAALASENRRLEEELANEERELTDRRAEMDAAAFRELADAFDEKVQTIRRTQEAKARALSQQAESDRLEFLQTARPVLENLMKEAGAGVILDRASVFLSANAGDITDIAITRIDAVLGDGAVDATGVVTPAPQDKP